MVPIGDLSQFIIEHNGMIHNSNFVEYDAFFNLVFMCLFDQKITQTKLGLCVFRSLYICSNCKEYVIDNRIAMTFLFARYMLQKLLGTRTFQKVTHLETALAFV